MGTFVTAVTAYPLQTRTLADTARNLTSWPQVVSHVSPEFGGIATSVPRLARASLSVSRHHCPILGFCHGDELLQLSQEEREGVVLYPPDRTPWMSNLSLRGRFARAIQASNGLHIHGLWQTHSMVSAALAKRCKRPYIISAHGMLEPWALRQRRVRKALYAALIEIKRLQRAACLRALSHDEAGDYRRLGLTNPVAIVPNGIDLPGAVSPELFLESCPEARDKRVVLFLGRLHAKKGLLLLLKAWAQAVRSEDFHLVIAGPDSEGTRASLEALAAELGLTRSITFTGMLSAEKKWAALAASSLFVLPSYSEGFSVAILEALGSGVPVLATNKCHLPEIESFDCGLVVEPEVNAIAEALTSLLALSPEQAKAMGEGGIKLVKQKFETLIVGRQLAEVYDWLQGGSKPQTVEVI